MRRTLISIVFGVFSSTVIFVITFGFDFLREYPELRTYIGKIEDENGLRLVEIEEEILNGKTKRSVHIFPVKPRSAVVLGRDNNSDGKWEDILYCDHWPNMAQKPRTLVVPYITTIQAEEKVDLGSDLREALGKVLNQEHLARTWRWSWFRREYVSIYERKIAETMPSGIQPPS